MGERVRLLFSDIFLRRNARCDRRRTTSGESLSIGPGTIASLIFSLLPVYGIALLVLVFEKIISVLL